MYYFILLIYLIFFHLNYETFDIITQNFDINLLLDNTYIISSKNEAKLSIYKIPIIDKGDYGFNIIILARRGNSLILKCKDSFNIGQYCSEINRMNNFINKNLDFDDILFIVVNSTYSPFRLLIQNTKLSLDTIKLLRKIGMRMTNFTENSNYILITSIKKDIYFESVSEDTVYFPNIDIISNECRLKPLNIYPLKKYFFANPLQTNNESINRCALEAGLYNSDKFAITDNNVCLIINDDQYNYIENNSRMSDQCYMGTGSFVSLNLYKFNKLFKNDNTHGITIFNMENFKGVFTILYEGIYYKKFGGLNVIDSIKSIITPVNFICHIINNDKRIFSFFGPSNYSNLHFNNIYCILVQKIKGNSVLFCEDDINKGVCYSFEPGNYRLPSFLFLNIKTIYISPHTRKVNIYKDLNYNALVQSFVYPFQSHKLHIRFPRIVRSIEII